MYFLNFLSLFYLINISIQEKLIFVMTHFRHGARAPNSINKNNLDKVNELWTIPGELTAVGMRMQYLLGLRNRKRYIDNYKLLSKKFDPHEMLVYSTNFNRTLMSIYSQLQGLYPHKSGVGLSLNEEQEVSAIPQVKINESYIKDEVDIMNSSALPDFMTVIPVRMISDNDRKISVRCSGSSNNTKNTSMESIIAVKYYFNQKYKKYLNEFFNESTTYDFSFLKNFCDAFVADYTDRRKITELKNTGVNFEELAESCYEVLKINFRDYSLNAGQNHLDLIESSKILREMIRLMKQRVDDDINNVTEIDYDDFSRPKMMMISAHDTTVSCHEITIIKCFNLDLDTFQLAKFTAQMAFEVVRKDDNETDLSSLSYKDYTVNYYFNDDKVLSVSLEEFIEKMDNYLWTEEEVDSYCSVDNSKKNETDDSSNDGIENNNVLVYGITICALSVLLAVCIVINIILIVLFKRGKKGGSDKAVSLVSVSKNDA